MATMYPEFFPGNQDPDNPEYAVYQSLRVLDDHFHVFYSKRFKGGKHSKEETEVDFLIFDGKLTLICLEVKGGMLEYRGDANAWFQNGAEMSPQPDRQASAATRSVIEYLGDTTRSLNIGWGLCMPQCCLPDTYTPPTSVPKDVLIDMSGIADPQEAIGRVSRYYCKRYNKPGLKATESRHLIARLTRGIGFVNKVGVRVAQDHKQLIQVTNEQFNVLEDLQLNRRVAVRGCAGSGKTLIAQEFAKQLAADDKSVLLLFFNRAVANHVRYGLDNDLPIECTTFHSLARQLIEDDDPDWWEKHLHDASFWDTVVPARLWDLNPQAVTKYDAIIVDEGQDFKPEWYELLEQLFLDREGEGRFVVFYDDRQDIFNRWDDLPWSASDTFRKALKKNCRNTRSIIEHIKTHLECDMEPFDASPIGLPVVTRAVSDDHDECSQFTKDLRDLLGQNIRPDQIVLLLNNAKTNSSISHLTTVGTHRIESMGRTLRGRSRAIRYSYLRVFKGLEADIVFVLGLDRSSADYAEAVYNQASRARGLLYLYVR